MKRSDHHVNKNHLKVPEADEVKLPRIRRGRFSFLLMLVLTLAPTVRGELMLTESKMSPEPATK